eukprot:4596976-Amphidinium_carterae.1
MVKEYINKYRFSERSLRLANLPRLSSCGHTVANLDAAEHEPHEPLGAWRRCHLSCGEALLDSCCHEVAQCAANVLSLVVQGSAAGA